VGPPPNPGPLMGSYAPGSSQQPLRSNIPYAGGYGGFAQFQGQMGPPPQFPYGNPTFPRPTASQAAPSEALPPLQTQTALQLPPIRPAAFGAPIDPALAAQEYRQSEQPPSGSDQVGKDDGTQEPDSKRPKMDIQGILGPRE
jgi:hypothetical protein